uniref:Phage protein n=1 Tax=Syphacia muris TaxID=451379 RepID=A0A0N5AH36_9BILA
MTEYYNSDDVDKLKEAVAILAGWRARMGDSLHVAAEMTDLLLRAIIMDLETDPNDWFKLGYLRTVYGIAIIRLSV